MRHEFKSIILVVMIILLFSGCNTDSGDKPYISWGLLGGYPSEPELNPYKLIRDDQSMNVGSIVYSIRRDFKTAGQISDESGIDLGKVRRKLDELENCRLVRRTDKGYIVDFPFWDRALRDSLNSMGSEIAGRIVEVIKSEIPGMLEIYPNSTVRNQGFTWEETGMIIIGGFLLDTGLNDRGLRRKGIFSPGDDTPERPGGYRYWFRGVEGGWGPFYKCVHIIRHNENRDIWLGLFVPQAKEAPIDWGQVWDIFDEPTEQIMFPLITEGRMRMKDMADEVNLPRDSLEAIIQKMGDAGLVELIGKVVHRDLPTFYPEDRENILGRVENMCERIINEIYIPYIPEIENRWAYMAPKNWEIEGVDKFVVREVFDRAYNISIDKLVKEKVLYPPPTEPPFLYWAFNGAFDFL